MWDTSNNNYLMYTKEKNCYKLIMVSIWYALVGWELSWLAPATEFRSSAGGLRP